MAGRGPFTNDVCTEAVRGLPKKEVVIKVKGGQRRATKGGENFADIIYEWPPGGSVFALRAAFLWHSTGIRIRPLFQAFIVLGKRGKGGTREMKEQ